jgi:hypothetical protein
VIVLPDEIWVGDEEAMRIAASTFPGLPIKLVENPYFAEMRDALSNMDTGNTNTQVESTVLYLCEPVREHAMKQLGAEDAWGYTEESALRYFLANVHLLGNQLANIKIRPHPSETLGKYEWAVESENFNVSISTGNSLPQDLASANTVAGCQSTGLVVALNAGKTVVCCIPPGGKASSLPHRNILSLQDIAGLQNK